VTLPAISPVLLFATIVGIIETLRTSPRPRWPGRWPAASPTAWHHAATGLPRGRHATYPQWIVEQGFRQFNLGYASALSVLLFVVAMLVTRCCCGRPVVYRRRGMTVVERSVRPVGWARAMWRRVDGAAEELLSWVAQNAIAIAVAIASCCPWSSSS
jgi:hypothetical protein